MSDLPKIDYNEVATSLANDFAGLKFQLAQLENLAAKLRDERDGYKARLDDLTRSPETSDPVSDATAEGDE